eukprot:Skav226745  [mRNA]  locus=scaffold5056:133319:136949:+ [translate_table: standard]
MWPKGMEPEQLLAGSVHGKQVAEDLLSAGARWVAGRCSNLQLLMSHGFGEAESRWALVIVDTRAFTFQLGTEEEQLALVPLLDLFNNRGMAKEGDVRTNRQLWQCSFEPEGSVEEGALLLAERSIEADGILTSSGDCGRQIKRDSSVASGRVVLELPKDAEDGGEMMPLARRLASTTPAELQRAAQRSDTPGREARFWSESLGEWR